MKTKTSTKAKPQNHKATKPKGKTDADLKEDMELLYTVYEAHREGMPFEACERKFGLRQSRGSTAYRMCLRFAKMAKEG